MTTTNSIFRYELQTAPAPLQTGKPATIYLSIYPPAMGGHCKRIEMNIPYGNQATDIFADAPSSSLIRAAGWTLMQSAPPKGSNTASISLTNGTPGYMLTGPVILRLDGTVSDAAGTVVLDVYDDSGVTGPKPKPTNVSPLVLIKTNSELYLDNFVASITGNQEIVSDFSTADKITLSWEGNADSYEVYRGNELVNPGPGNKTTIDLPDPLSKNTTFILKAIADDGKRTCYTSLALTVKNPALTCSSLVVNGPDNQVILSAKDGKTTLIDTLVEGSFKLSGNQASASMFSHLQNYHTTETLTRFTAPTDGIFLAQANSIVRDMNPMQFITTSVMVTYWHAGYSVTFGYLSKTSDLPAQWDNSYYSIPVCEGAMITIQTELANDLSHFWLPFGPGRLTLTNND